MDSAEQRLTDLVLRIDAALADGREAELLAALDIPVGREDQLKAAHHHLLSGLLARPDIGQQDLEFGEQPGWLRLGIMMAVVRWLDGHGHTCPHDPTAEQPEPVHLALWLPDLVVCGECTHLLVPPAHPSCAGCGSSATADGPRLVIVVAGFVAMRVFACAECMPPE